MNILFAPFAARHPNLNGGPSPKDYPIELAKQLASMIVENHTVIQVGGEGEEQMVPEFRKNLSFDQVGNLIAMCTTAICVDSYLQHHCWFLNKKAIVLWGISDPLIFGHSIHLNLLKDRSSLRQNQFDLYYSNEHNPEAFVTPDDVIRAIDSMENTG